MSELMVSKVQYTFLMSCFTCLALLFAMAPSRAQTLRDPTLPPMVQNNSKTAALLPSLSIGTGPPSIVVREGRSYVVLESHLYAQGRRYGEVRIERISETEVWFRERGVLYKISRFPGTRRSIAAPSAKTPLMLQFQEHAAP